MKITNDLIQQASSTYQKLTIDELKKLAGKAQEHSGIEVNNTYDTPRIIAKYWRPALPGNAVKLLDYLVYKTYGRGKEEEGDRIAWSQLIDGTVTKEKGVIVKRHDWGAGLGKGALKSNLVLLEVLGLIEVERFVNETTGEKETTLYRIRCVDWAALDSNEQDSYMGIDPFIRVKAAITTLREMGITISG